MEQKQMIARLRVYNRSEKRLICTDLEKQYMKYIDEHDYLYVYANYEAVLPKHVEIFLNQQHHFKEL